MATILRFPDRFAARPPQGSQVPGASASIVILPCIRREVLVTAVDAASAQRHA